MRQFLLIALLLALFSSAVHADKPPVDKAPVAEKPAAESDVNAMRLLAAIVPREGAVWHFKLMAPDKVAGPEREAFVKFIESIKFVAAKDADGEKTVEPKWELPKGWVQKPAAGMRLATIEIGEASRGVAIIVFRFGPESGDVVANVQRWAGQVGIKPRDEAAIKALAKTIKVDGKEATLVDITGAPGSASAAGAGPGAAAPQRPAKPETATAKTPEGWTRNEKPGQFITTQYDLTKDGKTATLTISSAGGDLGANLNRWRAQVGLEAWDTDSVGEAFKQGKELKESKIAGRKALLVDLVGEAGEKQERILGALAPTSTGEKVWFFKMRGPAALVESQRKAFEGFLESVKFEE